MVRFRSWIVGTVAFVAAALPLSAGAVDKVNAIDSIEGAV